MSRSLVYIAGPLSAETPDAMEGNARVAMRWMTDLLAAGYLPFCPHLSLYADRLAEQEHGAGLPYETWIDWCLAWLEKCDVLLYLGSSPGADRELARAQELGLVIIYADWQSRKQVESTLRLAGLLHG